MRPGLAVTSALLVLLGSGIAEAADSALLAQSAGFLLGNAHRCGVPTDRVDHAEKVIHRLIVAVSYDPTEEAAANSRFAETYRANAFPDQDSELSIPRCQVVIAQFERLERHHQQAGLN
jgi:hypothetical protein